MEEISSAVKTGGGAGEHDEYFDNAADQIKKIQELHLPVAELDACNLMAFYLGWAIKRGQMSNPFLSQYREIVEAVRAV